MPSGPLPTSPLRYTNKDGSKYITVPRKSPTLDVETTHSPAPSSSAAALQLESKLAASMMDYARNSGNNIPEIIGGQSASVLNRKKKKKKTKAQLRREYEESSAQTLLDSQSSFGLPAQHNHSSNGPSSNTAITGSPGEYQQHLKASLAEFEADADDVYYSDEEAPYDPHYIGSNNHPPQIEGAIGSGKKKNKKKKKKALNPDTYQGGVDGAGPGANSVGRATTGNQASAKKAKDRIWNTSTNEERERIKEFWLSLGEDERRSLVQVEKEAVLKKMKEQQKHSCSCSVCGRKRTAIEEELEVLYDAYYEELEQYANQQQSKFAGSISPLPPHFSTLGPPPPPPAVGPPPNRIEELGDDGDDYEDEDDYEEDDEDVVEDEPPLDNDPRPDFFTFGNSLTVQGGILTVADDLLKNDGKKFIEMMEQLAERRMQREEEATAVASGHPNMTMPLSSHGLHTNNHAPQAQDYEDDDEEEEEEEEYEYEEEEEDDEGDPMTEEQRMEEGRRMFQIFAARMFEQRVLQAYREKVAQERQKKLLEELDEENRLKEERELRRVKEKERKKDRRRQQKLAKEEERLKRVAEKAAEEAAQRAIEEKKAEEIRKRREEQRLKKEIERKAAEEERQKKEEEKKRRQQEERERELERERKRKELERRKREEAAKKAKEEKEGREREAKEKREKEERERRAREAKAKKQADEERLRREDEEKRAAAAATSAALAAARAHNLVPNPHHQVSSHQFISPRISLAAPAVPKQHINAPSIARPKTTSLQGSVGSSSPKTSNVLPRISTSASPNTPTLPQSAPGINGPPKSLFSQAQFAVPQLNSSLLTTPHTIGPPPGVPSPLADTSFSSLSPMAMNSPAHFTGAMPQRQVMSNGIPIYMQGPIPISSPQYRGFANTNGLQMPIPPTSGLRPVGQAGRGVFMNDLGGLPQPIGSPIPPSSLPVFHSNSPFSMSRSDTIPSAMHTHTRQSSGSFDAGAIQRPIPPAPIQRPQSTAPKADGLDSSSTVVGDLSNVLGSRALLDDDGLDMPLNENMPPPTRRGSSVFGSRPRVGFGGIFDIGSPSKDPFGTSPVVDWSPLPLYSTQPIGSWTNGAGWSDKETPSRRRRGETRLDQLRLLACKVCQEHSSAAGQPQFLDREMVLKAMSAAALPELLPIQQREIDDLVEVEGDAQNGGGGFVVDQEQNGNISIKFEPGDGDGPGRDKHVLVPGEIGSPSIIGSLPAAGSGFSGTIPPMGPPPGIGPTMPIGSATSITSGFKFGTGSSSSPRTSTSTSNSNQFMV